MEMHKIRDNLIEEKIENTKAFFQLERFLLILATIVWFFILLQATCFNVVVEGISMQPNLYKDDVLVVNKYKTPERGDIIIIDKDVWLIKRVIGLPGETVSLKDGYVYIDGEKLDEPYVIRQGVTQPAMNGWTEFTVPEGEYLFMGDNRVGTRSKDSRYPDYLTCKQDELLGVVTNWSLHTRWINNNLVHLFDRTATSNTAGRD